jgi:hypothetical protein
MSSARFPGNQAGRRGAGTPQAALDPHPIEPEEDRTHQCFPPRPFRAPPRPGPRCRSPAGPHPGRARRRDDLARLVRPRGLQRRHGLHRPRQRRTHPRRKVAPRPYGRSPARQPTQLPRGASLRRFSPPGQRPAPLWPADQARQFRMCNRNAPCPHSGGSFGDAEPLVVSDYPCRPYPARRRHR